MSTDQAKRLTDAISTARDGGQRTALYWRWFNILTKVWS